ncbi:unnamed protein product [Durusdinium trenchii]|uniref:EF-hand domain-containing protein n=1 Tax=Durusdinium trenchii TaxID=1381693 RepID=A0ABP0N5F8_9DINO
MSSNIGRRSVEVRSLWDAHDTNENGYLDQTELESLLIHLHKKLGGSGDLSEEAIKRCAEILHVESGELRKEVFARRFTHLWSQKDKLLELSPKVTVVSDTSEPSSSVNLWLAASMHGVEGEPFPEGSVCWVRDSAVMTEKEDLSSVKKKDIPGASKGLHSARLLVLGHGRSKSRLRVQDSSGDVGWVSTTLEGRLLLQPSSAWLTVSETHEKEAVYQAMQKLWHAHKAAQEQGANLASELLAAHHQAVQQDAIRWRQEQDIAELEDELDEEEKVCKSFKRKVKELELSIAKEEQRNGEEKQIQALEERNSTRLKSELAEFESEAGRLRIELEDSRAALRTAQLERRSKEEQHESRISALTGLMHEEVNKAHERLTVTEMATTAAQRTLQLVEDEEAGKTSKSADELNRMKDYVRAESEAFDKCEFKLESIEKREKTRSLFENVQVEFLHKEKRTNDELREATLLRNEAAQAADEALALRIRLAREDQDLTSRQASLSTAEQQASQKLELAAVELDRARILTQELTKDKAEAFSELAEARRVSGRAQQERELAHQQSLEAEMAAFEAMKACEAADEDRKKVEQALLSVTEDLEKAARQQREGLELAAKGESSLHRMHMIEEKVSQYSEENQRLSQVLATERAACNEIRSEKERMQLELRDLTRLTRFASPRMRGQSGVG